MNKSVVNGAGVGFGVGVGGGVVARLGGVCVLDVPAQPATITTATRRLNTRSSLEYLTIPYLSPEARALFIFLIIVADFLLCQLISQ